MSFWNAMLRMEWVKASRTLGLPTYRPFTTAKLFQTITAMVVWAAATVLIVQRISAHFKLALLVAVFQNWPSLLLSMVSVGILIGQNWLKYGELREIQFLMEQPIARMSIASWKMLSLVVELTGLALILTPAIIPWGININWGEYALQLWLVFLLTIIGIIIGILLDALLYRLIPSASVSKIVTYLVALMLITGTILFPPFAISPSMMAMTIAGGTLLPLIVLGVYFAAWAILARFENADSTTSKTIKSKPQSNWGKFTLAVARKDIVHYWREAGQLLQLLLISAVLILILSQISNMGPLVTRVMLLGIPYSFAGITTLQLTGSDGVLMTLIKHCKGSLRGYYGTRCLFSYFFVLLPSVLAYSVLAYCFYRQGLSLPYYGVLVYVCLISVAMASGISVVFKKEAPNPLLPVRGTTALGEVIYWIIGIGPILQLAMWVPIPAAIPHVLTSFNVLAAIGLIAAAALWIMGICRVDAPDV